MIRSESDLDVDQEGRCIFFFGSLVLFSCHEWPVDFVQSIRCTYMFVRCTKTSLGWLVLSSRIWYHWIWLFIGVQGVCTAIIQFYHIDFYLSWICSRSIACSKIKSLCSRVEHLRYTSCKCIETDIWLYLRMLEKYMCSYQMCWEEYMWSHGTGYVR
jgi:hypothetical protein